MLSYERKAVRWKKRGIVILSLFLLIAVGTLTWVMNQSSPSEPTVAESDQVLLTLPQAAQTETVNRPFSVEAVIAVDYFDGESGEVDAFTKFEDVYRSSQGIDYTYNDEPFPVLAMMSGEVSDVREDELFGNTVVITSGELTVTLQSLGEVSVSKGDSVKQGEVIGTAGTCVYSKDLGNHLHLVSEVGGRLVDPQSIYDKSAEELSAMAAD